MYGTIEIGKAINKLLETVGTRMRVSGIYHTTTTIPRQVQTIVNNKTLVELHLYSSSTESFRVRFDGVYYYGVKISHYKIVVDREKTRRFNPEEPLIIMQGNVVFPDSFRVLKALNGLVYEEYGTILLGSKVEITL